MLRQFVQPEREEHNGFDAEELWDGFDRLKLFLRCFVEEYKAVHGPLQKMSKQDVK